MSKQFKKNIFSTTSIRGNNVIENILPVKKYNDIEPCENSVPTCNTYPDSIEFELNNNVNIIYIHSIVRSKLIYDKNKFIELSKNIETLETMIKLSSEDNNLQKIKNERSLNKLRNDIKKLNLTFWKEYIEKSTVLFDRYLEIKDSKFDKDKIECLSIIKNYINIVITMNILDINIYYSDESVNECPCCGNELTISSDEQKCKICGFFNDSTFILDEQQEISESFSPKTDLVLKPFIEWINRFLGISNESFPEKRMFEEFDKKCIERGYPTGEQIRSGQYEQPKLKFLLYLMQETKYSAYYKIKNKIRHEYWGWPLPVLSQDQITRMCDDYIKSQLYYPEVANRKQNLNSEIRGYYHVRAVGLEISTADFKFPGSTDDTKIDANIVWEKICKHCDIDMHLIKI
jgi:hypothetical protein